MNFYKFICILALVLLIVCLACIGVAMNSTSNSSIFPPNVSECPDFYKMDSSYCTPLYTITKSSDSDCTSKSFDSDPYTNSGMGPSSGMCEKQKWANACGVNWDGITNNPAVCYQIIT